MVRWVQTSEHKVKVDRSWLLDSISGGGFRAHNQMWRRQRIWIGFLIPFLSQTLIHQVRSGLYCSNLIHWLDTLKISMHSMGSMDQSSDGNQVFFFIDKELCPAK